MRSPPFLQRSWFLHEWTGSKNANAVPMETSNHAKDFHNKLSLAFRIHFAMGGHWGVWFEMTPTTRELHVSFAPPNWLLYLVFMPRHRASEGVCRDSLLKHCNQQMSPLWRQTILGAQYCSFQSCRRSSSPALVAKSRRAELSGPLSVVRPGVQVDSFSNKPLARPESEPSGQRHNHRKP